MIRPLVYVEESEIIEFTARNEFPIICCSCPVVGTVDQKRQSMKQLIAELAKENPQIRKSMIGALGNVQLRHLMDRSLSSFETTGSGGDLV